MTGDLDTTRRPLRLGAVLLAAGESSRMGRVKALTPLGERTPLERLLATLEAAGVHERVVVTGYHHEAVAPEVARLGARSAHNARPERGMFSSVQTGVASLASSCNAFFVLPVDYALVRPEVLAACAGRFAEDACEMVRPCCAGLSGHPPLLAGHLREPLVAQPADSNLRAFLEAASPVCADVEVDDVTVLLDMDTPEDLERMRRFATFLDAAVTPAPGRPALETAAAGALPPPVTARAAGNPAAGRLTEADAGYLLDLLRAPARVVAHCRAVAVAGEAMARALQGPLPALDADLVRTACLLHDLVRGQGARKHALMGERILLNLGLPRLAAVVGAHMVLPFDPESLATISEEELVYLADKMVVEDQPVGLVGREERALAKCGDDEGSQRGIRARMQVGETIAAKVESILGRPLASVVSLVPFSG